MGEEEVLTALLGEQDLLSLITMTHIVLVDQRKLVSLIIYCFCVVFFSINYESRNQKPSFLHKYVYLFIYQAPIVQTLDSAIHRINHYPAEKYYGNQLRYPLASDLSGG